MKLISKADVVLALGTRLLGRSARCRSMVSTTGQRTPRSSRLTPMPRCFRQKISVGICGMPEPRRWLVARLKGKSLACHGNRDATTLATVAKEKKAWEKELDGWSHERDAYSLEVSAASKYMHPRQMLRELERQCHRPRHGLHRYRQYLLGIEQLPALQRTALDVRCDEFRQLRLRFPHHHRRQNWPPRIGRRLPTSVTAPGALASMKSRPVCENIPVTAVVFNNGQWGAEKKNHVDFTTAATSAWRSTTSRTGPTWQ